MSSAMFSKKEVFTVITPIPGLVPRQLAIDILHSHSEVITVNPLVLGHKPIPAPRNCPSDEYFSTWYEITERIQYVPGLGKLGSGKISFKGCFHDMPWGLQTHIYAPANVDLRNRYRISGNQPGFEPPEPPEIGLAALGAPSDGLYLRDDVEIRCNIAMVSFVKSQLKAASKEMVSRIIKKAQLLDSGVLHAMIDDGKMKVINPNDRSSAANLAAMSPRTSPNSLQHPSSPSPPPTQYQVPRHVSYQPYTKPGSHVQNSHWSAPYGGYKASLLHPSQAEFPSQGPRPPQQTQTQTDNMPVEMAGDFYHPEPSPHLQPRQPSPNFTSDRDSTTSGDSSRLSPQPANDWRWSQSQATSYGGASRPTSYSSDTSGGFQSPGLDHQGFSSELSTHKETSEEHNVNVDALEKLDPASRGQHAPPNRPPKVFAYNPADYAKVGGSHPARGTSQSYGYGR